MSEVIERARYHCTTDGHYKFYELTIEYPYGPDNRYKVFGCFGKIGSEGCIKPYEEYVFLHQARHRLHKIANLKIAKGYTFVQTPVIVRTKIPPPATNETKIPMVIPPSPSSRIGAILQEKVWQQKAQS